MLVHDDTVGGGTSRQWSPIHAQQVGVRKSCLVRRNLTTQLSAPPIRHMHQRVKRCCKGELRCPIAVIAWHMYRPTHINARPAWCDTCVQLQGDRSCLGAHTQYCGSKMQRAKTQCECDCKWSENDQCHKQLHARSQLWSSTRAKPSAVQAGHCTAL